MATDPNFRAWAVLIGIDVYSNKSEGENLYGCVRDVEDMRHVLETRVKMPLDHIKILIAPHGEKVPPARMPTKSHVIEALEDITCKSEEGDFVYIHYSGHGDRMPTAYPDLKDAGAKDEVLCTLEEDIRDVQFGNLLDNMANKGLAVLVVLDCCHSGGATRAGKENRVRCRHIVPAVEHDGHGLDQASGFRGVRNAAVIQSWFYRDRGYNLIAACQPHELAAEHSAHDGTIHGALTFYLLETLAVLGGEKDPVHYGKLQEVLEAKCTHLAQQPMLLGDRRRLVFRSVDLLQPEAPNFVASILRVDSCSVTLDRGLASRISVGDKFKIYQPSQWFLGAPSTDISELPEVIVSAIKDTESEARFRQESSGTLKDVDSCCLAKLYERSRPAIVKFIGEYTNNPISIVPALEDLRQNWALYADPCDPVFIDFGPESVHADFYLQLTQDLYFCIKNKEGILMQNLPTLRATTPGITKILMGLLQHLNSYRALANLKSPTTTTNLSYEFEIVEDQVEPGDEESLSSWRIRFKNLHTRPVYITLLNLTPVYGVHQILPAQGSSSVAVDAGKEIQELVIDIRVPTLLMPLAASPHFTMTDVIKLIVTTKQTDFRYYELPDLEPLDTSMNASEGLPDGKLRNTRVRKPKVASWLVDQKEIVTTRSSTVKMRGKDHPT